MGISREAGRWSWLGEDRVHFWAMAKTVLQVFCCLESWCLLVEVRFF